MSLASAHQSVHEGPHDLLKTTKMTTHQMHAITKSAVDRSPVTPRYTRLIPDSTASSSSTASKSTSSSQLLAATRKASSAASHTAGNSLKQRTRLPRLYSSRMGDSSSRRAIQRPAAPPLFPQSQPRNRVPRILTLRGDRAP
jgi:hypothetical protein